MHLWHWCDFFYFCTMNRLVLLSLTIALHGLAYAQRTVGLLSIVDSQAWPGYNLIYPHNQSNVYLLDNCGEVVHSWTDDPQWRPGNTAYILPDGNLVKTKRLNVFQSDPIWAGGGGAIIEMRDWDNNLIWQFELNTANARLHHDFKVLPNGHVIMIAWELKTGAEAIEAGRNPALLPQNKIWPDYILEINPTTMDTVWEWHAWDHLIQDFDPSKANYGDPAEHPELIDINWDTSNGHPDWMHVNAIDYNPALDQILISVPTFHEVWVIDHSTTTEEAAGHSGGRAGRGGDLLYRWGNPLAYRAGDIQDQRLFYPHNIHWVGPFLEDTHPHFGKLAVFNNRVNPAYSTVNVFNPAFDTISWTYPFENGVWAPSSFDLSLTHPDTFQINSDGLSSVQLLPNGNVLVCSGRWGYAFELNAQNEVVWEYRTPLSGGSRVPQGQVLSIGTNATFRMDRYPLVYSAFEGRNLIPQGPLELNALPGLCQTTDILEEQAGSPKFEIGTNPTSGYFEINSFFTQDAMLELRDMTGRLLWQATIAPGRSRHDIRHLENGIYLVRVPGHPAQRLVVQY